MKTTFKWEKDFLSTLDNSRGHSVNIDLPTELGGTNVGATAMELCAMSLSGCIGTIFTMIANKMKLTYSSLSIELNAEKGANDPTIVSVDFVVKISSDMELEKFEKCLHITEEKCPVGIIFNRAGIPVNGRVEKI